MFKSRSITDDYVWDSGLHVFPTCPFKNQYKNKILLVPITLMFLARKPFNTEYLLLSKYKEDDDAIVIDDDYCVPEQEATVGSVEAKNDCPPEYNVSIHKHPAGVDDFSLTDWENIIQNNDINILIVNGKISKIIMRKKMPCGEYLAFEVPHENIILYSPTKNINAVKKKAKILYNEIKKKAKIQTTYLYGYKSRSIF